MPPPSASSGSAQAGAFSFTTPSPDDAVRAAQAGRVPGAGLGGRGAGRGAAAPPPAAAAPVVAQAAAALGRMSITPPSAAPAPAAAPAGQPWSEYVPEAWEAAATAASSAPPPPLHLVCLGHVDAGKSTAMGRLLHEVGAVSAAAVASHARGAAAAGKSSFAWAWALDERPEERARGLTVDVALARFATPMGRAVVLLDAPGHRDFVPAALAGAARADAAVLMLDATPGAFEAGFAQPGAGAGAGGGQTREHAALARACGVSHLIVAVNKLDTCGWAQERYDAIRAEASPALRAAGWRDAAVTWLPLAGREGVNLSAPVAGTAHPLASWWRGPSLLGAVDALPPRPPPPPAPLRLPVWDLLSGGVRSLGPNAAGGKLESGALRPGMQVLLQPAGVIATVKALEADGTPLAAARAGDAVEVGLSGLADGAALSLGTVLCSPGWAAPVAARLTARVTVLDSRMPLLRGATVTLHVGAGREPARVAALLTQLDPATGEQIRARPRCLARGHAGVVEIIPERPLVAERYADCRALGRLALREGGRTLAVGVVLDIWPEVEAATQ
jgi:elongation factor 1 alpha-like protein